MSEPSFSADPPLFQEGGKSFGAIEDRRRGRLVEIAIRALAIQLGHPPDDEQIAAELGLELQAYQDLLGRMKGLSLGLMHADKQPCSREEYLTYLAGRREDDLRLRYAKREMTQKIADAIGSLRQPERVFAALYYYEELTIQEIGLTLDMPESGVWRLRASTLLHLRAKLAELGDL